MRVSDAPGQAATVREQVLRAIAANRTPGFHFPGHLLNIRWAEVTSSKTVLELPSSPHLNDEKGNVDVTALGVLADTALSTVARRTVSRGERLGTVQLQMQFTGNAARGDVVADVLERELGPHKKAHLLGAEATLRAMGRVICYASGVFVRLNPPESVTLSPLPWQRMKRAGVTKILNEADLTAAEQELLQTCDRALARSSQSFLKTLWGVEHMHRTTSTSHRLKVGAHTANRVGHVQGGILLGTVFNVARDTTPPCMSVSNVSVWYTNPSSGSWLQIQTRPIHTGRTMSVIRTQVKSSTGRVVIEAVTQHAA